MKNINPNRLMYILMAVEIVVMLVFIVVLALIFG